MEARLIPAVIFFLLFLLFAAPLTVGIINIGNGAGMAVSLILTVMFLFWDRTKSFAGKCWDRPVGKLLLSLTGVIAVVCIILAALISIFMIKAANDPPRDENTTVVVLGCKVRNGAPSLMLKRRLDAAYDYLSAHEGVKVVVSGGKGDDEVISEAQCMRDYLVGRGIASERIFMEDRSVSTEENLRFSKNVIAEKGLPEKITIITDNYHQLRAEMIAEKNGIESYSISGSTSWYLLPTYWVREWFGIIYCKLF